jgi:hypothetical protein
MTVGPMENSIYLSAHHHVESKRAFAIVIYLLADPWFLDRPHQNFRCTDQELLHDRGITRQPLGHENGVVLTMFPVLRCTGQKIGPFVNLEPGLLAMKLVLYNHLYFLDRIHYFQMRQLGLFYRTGERVFGQE